MDIAETGPSTADAGVEAPAHPTASDAAAEEPKAPAELMFSFVPSNVPTPTGFVVDGDMVFSRKECGTEAEINTDKGSASCVRNSDVRRFSFGRVAQPSQSSFPAKPPILGVFATRNFAIESGVHVRVAGRAALVVLALERASIGGTLDASASGVFEGAGSTERNCAPGSSQMYCPSPVPMGGGVYCGPPQGTTSPYGSQVLKPLLAGASGCGLGAGGGGGGAVQITAGMAIEVPATGVITAGGGGGGAGEVAGGGGSGGAILIESPSVMLAGTLAANGGSGGCCEPFTAYSDGVDGLPGKHGACPGCLPAAGCGAAGPVLAGGSGQGHCDLWGTEMHVGGSGGSVGRVRINTLPDGLDLAPSAVISPSIPTECTTTGWIGD